MKGSKSEVLTIVISLQMTLPEARKVREALTASRQAFHNDSPTYAVLLEMWKEVNLAMGSSPERDT